MSFLERFSLHRDRSPKESAKVIAQSSAPTTSETDFETSDPTTPSGPEASCGAATTAATPPSATVEDKFSRTSAISRLEEALTKKALTWCEMLEDPKVDAKTQIEMFKLASDHLAKMRRAGGDDDDPDTKSKLPGIDALRELMEGTAKKAIRSEMDELIDEHGILTVPAFKPQGGRPSDKEVKRRMRLNEAGLHYRPPHAQKSRAKAAGDDSDLAKLLNGKGK